MASRDSLRLQITGDSGSRTETLEPGRYTIGRWSRSDIRLDDDSLLVSREHAVLEWAGGRWLLRDSSKHGTRLNSVRLESDRPAVVQPGDRIEIGPWALRISAADEPTTEAVRTMEDHGPSTLVSPVPVDETVAMANRRVSLLLRFAQTIHAVRSEAELAEATARAALEGTGFPRAMVVRPEEGVSRVTVLASCSAPGSAGAGPATSISRSLLHAALRGSVVRLSDEAWGGPGASIVQLGIKQAVCAPVMTEESVAAFLYVDARTDGARTEPDAPAFCAALAQLAGVALGNLARRAIADRHSALQAELSEAHHVQRTLMPAEHGTMGVWRYAVRMVPGRTVAGDLFDIVELPDGGVAFALGDVAGKGAAAGIVMTAVIAQLHASLGADPDPGLALRTLNRYLVRRTGGRFVSLWLGVGGPSGGTVSFADAGHGHGFIVRAGAVPERLPIPNGMVLGASEDAPLGVSTIVAAPGDRVVLFSDGVVEQRSPDGEQFGMQRTAAALAGSGSFEEDVEALHRAVCAWAQSKSLTDDLTAASFGYD